MILDISLYKRLFYPAHQPAQQSTSRKAAHSSVLCPLTQVELYWYNPIYRFMNILHVSQMLMIIPIS